MSLDLSFQIFHKYGLLLTLHLCKPQNESAGKIYRVSTADMGGGLGGSSLSKQLPHVC